MLFGGRCFPPKSAGTLNFKLIQEKYHHSINCYSALENSTIICCHAVDRLMRLGDLVFTTMLYRIGSRSELPSYSTNLNVTS